MNADVQIWTVSCVNQTGAKWQLAIKMKVCYGTNSFSTGAFRARHVSTTATLETRIGDHA